VDGSERNEATQPPVTEALEDQKSRAIATLETGLAPSSNPCLPVGWDSNSQATLWMSQGRKSLRRSERVR
jgi:hypothetical protein